MTNKKINMTKEKTAGAIGYNGNVPHCPRCGNPDTDSGHSCSGASGHTKEVYYSETPKSLNTQQRKEGSGGEEEKPSNFRHFNYYAPQIKSLFLNTFKVKAWVVIDKNNNIPTNQMAVFLGKWGKSHSEETAKLVNETIAKNEKPYKRVPCTIIYKTKKKI